jgi:hypothetical protein
MGSEWTLIIGCDSNLPPVDRISINYAASLQLYPIVGNRPKYFSKKADEAFN